MASHRYGATLRIGLYDHELSELSSTLVYPIDYAALVMKCVDLLLRNGTRKMSSSRKYSGELWLKHLSSNDSRVFIYHGNHKYVSFYFPFNVDVKDSLRFYCRQYEIDFTRLHNMEVVLNALKDDEGKHKKGKYSLPITLSEISDTILNNQESDEIITPIDLSIVSLLITVESGYIRYDYDPIHTNGKIHPLHHLDINYSLGATYKQGLYNKITKSDFESLFCKNKEKMYLHHFHTLLLPSIQDKTKRKRNFLKKQKKR